MICPVIKTELPDGLNKFVCPNCGVERVTKAKMWFNQCGVQPASNLLPAERPYLIIKGPGDYLHDFINRWIGKRPNVGCQCKSRIQQMNIWGPVGCKEHLEEIVTWLIEEADKQKWWKYTAKMPFARAALRHVVLHCIRQAENYKPESEVSMDYSNCSAANSALSIEDMCRVIDAAPPGPWPNGWASWDNTVEAMRVLSQRYADNLIPDRTVYSEQRGIVIAGGGYKYFPGVWVGVNLLRKVGCTLPVELWYLGDEECDPAMRRLLEPLGVTCVDALEVSKKYPCRILCGWELKLFAIKYSKFAEVLFLDADNGVVRDPTYLFDLPQYKEKGAVLWPDYGFWTLKPDVWTIFGIPMRQEPAIESGQVLINKQVCTRELNMALWYAEHSDFYFKVVYGDKECFHLGWRKLDSDYAIPKRPPGWKIHTIIQYDFDDNVLFQHRCQDKWKKEGNRKELSLANEEYCFEIVADLFTKWDGRLWHNLNPTAGEQLVIDSLLNKRFNYRRVGYDERPMVFGPNSRVGEGSAECEVRWDVNINKGETVLTISRENRPTCHLKKDDAGVWRGAWLAHERMPVELISIEN
jgi:hypothetical protein